MFHVVLNDLFNRLTSYVLTDLLTPAKRAVLFNTTEANSQKLHRLVTCHGVNIEGSY